MIHEYQVQTILKCCFAYNFAELFTKGFKLEANKVHLAQAKRIMESRHNPNAAMLHLLVEVLRLGHPLTVIPNEGEILTLTMEQVMKNLQNPSINDMCQDIFDGRYSHFECFEVMQHAIYGKVVYKIW